MTDFTNSTMNNQSQAAAPIPATQRERFLRPVPALTIRTLVITLVGLVVLGWALSGTAPDMTQITRGKPPLVAVFDFLKDMVPAQYDLQSGANGYQTTSNVSSFQPFAIIDGKLNYAIAINYVIQTIQMAMVGTLLGVIVSLPFGLLAARNTSPHPAIYQGTRLILNSIRALPELIIALIFVSAVGLGPFSGVIALAVAGIGSKGKLFAEAIEAIDPQQVLAVRATGASRLQMFFFGVIPQALPVIISYSLLSFEANVRAATILGFVGAGGVGILIYQYTQLFQFDRLLGVIIIIVVTVTVIDRFSDFLRRKFI